MRLFKRVRDEEMAVQQPWYYGYAFYDPRINEEVFVVIPFNLLVSVGRWAYFRLAYGLRLDKPLSEAYARGKKDGYKLGLNARYGPSKQ